MAAAGAGEDEPALVPAGTCGRARRRSATSSGWTGTTAGSRRGGRCLSSRRWWAAPLSVHRASVRGSALVRISSPHPCLGRLARLLRRSAFAPLRRDERKAWNRAPGAREAYIAPALKPDGSANPRWITRSDWDVDRRIVATPRTERLFDLYKIYALAGRPGSAEASLPRPPPAPSMPSSRSTRRTSSRSEPPSGIRIRRRVHGHGARSAREPRRHPHRGDPPR